MKKILVIITIFAVVAIWSISFAQEAAKTVKYEYVGAKKCAMCHSKTKDNIGPSWEATLHAKAGDKLAAADKTNKVCLGCHSTGKTAAGQVLMGVQCEACHGPGSVYKDAKIMKDHALSVKNGLLVPDEKTCLKCHDTKKAPEGHKAIPAFKYADMKAKGIHAIPAKATK
jgi:hypothetical protein